jgi:hypothetical protein
MKRPVAARHPADAAVNDPQASPIHPRRPISGDVSTSTFVLGLGLGRAAAVVVRPASFASLGAAATGGFAAGFAAAVGEAGVEPAGVVF